MSHPYNDKRDHKVQHARVKDITAACGGTMSSGGSIGGFVAKQQKLIGGLAKKNLLRASGGAVKARADRPARAWGGRTGKGGKKKSGHTVNVIVGAHPPMAPGGLPGLPPRPPIVPGVAAPSAPLPPPAGAPSIPPRPMVPPPPGPMGGPPGVPGMPPGVAPPMMPRKKGGRIYSGGASGGEQGAKKGSFTANDKPFAFTTKGKGADGKVTNLSDSQTAGAGRGRTGIRRVHPSNKQDTPNIGRKNVITKATGGPIMSDSKAGVDMGPAFVGGSMGGIAKLQKYNRLKKSGYGGGNASIMNPTQNPKPGTGRG